MKLTRAADYAIAGVVCLAKRGADKRVLVADIARELNVSSSFLPKIFQELVSAKILIGHRGARGGFALLRETKDLTLLDIIEAVDGPMAINLCLESENACENRPECSVHPVWVSVQKKMVETLSATSIADILEDIKNNERQ